MEYNIPLCAANSWPVLSRRVQRTSWNYDCTREETEQERNRGDWFLGNFKRFFSCKFTRDTFYGKIMNCTQVRLGKKGNIAYFNGPYWYSFRKNDKNH